MSLDESERDHIYSMHPVHKRTFEFDTKSADALYQELVSVTEHRVSGITVTARSRMGLSTALRLAASALAELSDRLPVCLVTGIRTRANDVAFWASIIGQIAPPLRHVGDAVALQQALELNLAARALSGGDNRAVLIIDRAHDLTGHQLSLLTMLQDGVEQQGVRLIIALAGNSTLLSKRDDLIQSGSLEPVRRFFDRERRFSGIRDADELSFALRDFDERVYPADSNNFITRFYYQDAFDRGFRLAHESAHLWSVLYSLVQPYEDAVEVEVEYVMQTVCATLEESYPKGRGALQPDESIWRRHAEATSILSARRLEQQRQAEKKGKKS